MEEKLPKVSICTPTYNRRPFISNLIKCVENQTYPKELIEWIIVDDGTDKIEDLIENIIYVIYIRCKEKLPLGKKRNMLHAETSGDIIINMDDDDFYPPCRIEHAVSSLINSDKLCAGCNIMYIWYNDINKMYKLGPYNENHCTAASIAFKRELMETSSYDDTACLSEEKYFLKDYKLDIVKLDPLKTILVFSHSHNTYNKKKILSIPSSNVKEVDKTVDDFIKDNEIKTFFTKNIENMLSNYESGLPKYKPDVLMQMLDIEEKKNLHLLNNGSNASINMKDSFGNVTKLNQLQVIQTIHELQDTNQKLLSMLNEKTDIIKKLHYQLHKSLPKRGLQDLLLEINQLN